MPQQRIVSAIDAASSSLFRMCGSNRQEVKEGIGVGGHAESTTNQA